MTLDRLYTVLPRALAAIFFAFAFGLTATSPAAAATDDAAVAAYVDEGTFIVVAIDVKRVDSDALAASMDEMTQAMFTVLPIPGTQRGMVDQQVKQAAKMTKQWLTDMAAAGGERLYVVFDIADFGGGDDEHPYMVVPLGTGADAEKVTEVLKRGPGKPDEVVQVGHAVVLASATQQERLQKTTATPVERPEVKAALAAAGEAPVRIAFVPSEPVRTWVEGALPKIPDALGGGETAVVSRGVRWASAGAVQKPATVAKLTVQADNAEHAKALLELLTKGAAAVKQSAPPPSPDADPGEKPPAAATDPKLEGETITLSVNPIAVMTAVMRAQMQQALGGAAAAPAQPAAPPKADDGGL
jgi:hypothetical protein